MKKLAIVLVAVLLAVGCSTSAKVSVQKCSVCSKPCMAENHPAMHQYLTAGIKGKCRTCSQTEYQKLMSTKQVRVPVSAAVVPVKGISPQVRVDVDAPVKAVTASALVKPTAVVPVKAVAAAVAPAPAKPAVPLAKCSVCGKTCMPEHHPIMRRYIAAGIKGKCRACSQIEYVKLTQAKQPVPVTPVAKPALPKPAPVVASVSNAIVVPIKDAAAAKR